LLESRHWKTYEENYLLLLFIHLYGFPKNIKVGVKFTIVSLSYTNLYFSGEVYVRLIQNKVLILNCYDSILYFHEGRKTHTDKCLVGL